MRDEDHMPNRRSFFKILLGLPVVGGVLYKTALAKSTEKDYFINQFFIAGFQFYAGPEIISQMRPKDVLTLRAEPENPHDHFAVELLYGDIKIGHIPRTENKHISRLLKQNFPMVCRIKMIYPDRPTWEQVEAAVWIRSIPSDAHI